MKIPSIKHLIALYFMYSIAVIHAQTDSCHSTTQPTNEPARRPCLEKQLSHSLAEIQAQNTAILKSAREIPGRSVPIADKLPASDSLWQKYMREACALEADLAYPSNHKNNGSQLQDPKKQIHIMDCMINQIKLRKEYLDGLWQGILDRQSNTGLAEIQRQTKDILKSALKIPGTDPSFADSLLQSHTLWLKHMETDCTSRAKAGLGVSACRIKQIQLRKEYLDQLDASQP